MTTWVGGFIELGCTEDEVSTRMPNSGTKELPAVTVSFPKISFPSQSESYVVETGEIVPCQLAVWEDWFYDRDRTIGVLSPLARWRTPPQSQLTLPWIA
jgi:hypothetical protein